MMEKPEMMFRWWVLVKFDGDHTAQKLVKYKLDIATEELKREQAQHD